MSASHLYRLFRFGPLSLTLWLAACGTGTPPPQPLPSLPYSKPTSIGELDGKTRRALTGLFGEPELDVRDGQATKLQYSGEACVLDVYLYPPSTGKEPLVNYVEARLPDGKDTDSTRCIMALSQKR